MKLKKILASLAVLALIPSLSAPLTSYASNVASDGDHIWSKGTPSHTTGYNWGMTLHTESNADNEMLIYGTGDSDSNDYTNSGSVPGIEEILANCQGVVKGCTITVLYTTDKNILQEIWDFTEDKDNDGEPDHGTAEWMRDKANRDRLQVWESADIYGNYSQKCFYSFGGVGNTEPVMNDWYPVGVGKTANAFNTTPYVTYNSTTEKFGFNCPIFQTAAVYNLAGYNLNTAGINYSNNIDMLWCGITSSGDKIWEISASQSKFAGENEEEIKKIWDQIDNSEEASKSAFAYMMEKKGMSPNLIDTENFFFAFYVEPLIQIKLSYDVDGSKVWSAPVLFTPTMMAEYAEFSKGNAFISSKGLYSWTNPNNFINRTLLSTGTHGTSGNATVNDAGKIEINNANEVGLQDLVCHYGRGAYEVGTIVFKGQALDDLPNIPSVPVMKDRNAYSKDDTGIPDLAGVTSAENLTLDGCATIDAETWSQVEEILSYALNHTSTEPTCKMYTENDPIKERIKKVRDVSMHAVEEPSNSAEDRVYNQQYIAAYRALLIRLSNTEQMQQTIQIPTGLTTPTLEVNNSTFFKRSSNNNPSDYFDKHDDSGSHLGFGTTTSNMGVQQGNFNIVYSNIVMTHTELGSTSAPNFDISRGVSNYTKDGKVEESGQMGNATIPDDDGKVTYGELLKHPYSYAIKYRLFNSGDENGSFGEPTRPNVVILNEDTGETWDATISDGIWGNIQALSGYMYAKENSTKPTGDGGYNTNLTAYPIAGDENNGTSNSWSVHADAARTNRETINKLAPYINNYRDALGLINNYIDSEGNIKTGNYLKYTEELNTDVGKLTWKQLGGFNFTWSASAGLAGQNDAGQSMRSTFYNKVEEMDSNLTPEMNVILDKLSGSPITEEKVNNESFPYGMITVSGWDKSGSIAYAVNQFATDRFVDYDDTTWGHSNGSTDYYGNSYVCGWWGPDGYGDWDTNKIKSHFLDNNNIKWSSVAVDPSYYSSSQCHCLWYHLTFTSYDLIKDSVDSSVNKYSPTLSQAVNADKNALIILRSLLTAKIDEYEKAVKAFPINYACAYNLYADTYSNTWLVELDSANNNQNSVVNNDMTTNLTLRNTALDISAPYYKDEQDNTKIYHQSLMSVVINDRANSYSMVNGEYVFDASEYYANYLDTYPCSDDSVYPSNSNLKPVVYIAHKGNVLDTSNSSVDELSKSYLRMESVTGNNSAKTLTEGLENPFKVRVVNSYVHDDSAGTSEWRTGSALVRRSIYGLVNAPCWKDLSVASVLKDPYHYGIIINGWTSTSVNDIVNEWQQSKWQYQDDYDFTDLTRYILTNKSIILSDGKYTRYPVDKITANDDNVKVFYNSHLYEGDSWPSFGVRYPVDADTNNASETNGGYFVRWKGLADIHKFSYLTTRNANKGYAPEYTAILTSNNGGPIAALPNKEEGGIAPETYLVEGSGSDYNDPGYTTNSGLPGTERILQMYIYRNMIDPNNPSASTEAYDSIDLAHTNVMYKYMPELENNHAEIKGNPSAEYNENDGTFVDLWGNQGKVFSNQIFGMTVAAGNDIESTNLDKRDDYPFVAASSNGSTLFRPYMSNPTFAFMWVNAKTTHDISTRFNLTMKYNSKVVLNTSYSTDAEDIEAMSDVPFVKAGQTIELRTEGVDTKDNFIEVEASCLVPKNSDKGVKAVDNPDAAFKSAAEFEEAMDEFCADIVSNAKIGVASTFNGINTHSGLGNCIANSPLKTGMYTSYDADKKSGGSIDSTMFKTEADRQSLTAFEITNREVSVKNLVPSATSYVVEAPTVYKDGYAGKAQTALDSILYPSATGSTSAPPWYREYTDQYTVVTYTAKIKVTLNEFTAVISKYESDSLTASDKLLHANDDSITKAWKTEDVFGYKVPLQKVDGGTANSFISFVDLSGLSPTDPIIQKVNDAFTENGSETDAIKKWKLTTIPKYLVGQQTSVHVRGSIYDNT